MTLDLIHRSWHPVTRTADLGDGPLGVELLGRRLVLFRDATGTVAALDGHCPHRGTDLALGCVTAGALACPFHGWRFDAAGTCVAIPSLPVDTPIPAGARVPAAAATEAHGLVWVSLDPAADRADVPAVPSPDRAWAARRDGRSRWCGAPAPAAMSRTSWTSPTYRSCIQRRSGAPRPSSSNRTTS